MVVLNPLGQHLREELLSRHPEWVGLAETLDGGDLELAVPAPKASRAKQLIVCTSQGTDIWVRYAPPHMGYLVDSDRELHAVIEALLRDDAFFLVVTQGDEWVETTLLRPGQEPVLLEGQIADVVSWSGLHDRIVTYVGQR